MSVILQLQIDEKQRGNKLLLQDAVLNIEAGEKVALIGRNGAGKSTLFGLISGEDDDLKGRILLRKGATLIATRQEHTGLSADTSVIEYVLSELPEYAKLHHIIQTYPETMGDDMRAIETYSAALERFQELNYYQVEEMVVDSLQTYQLSDAQIQGPLANLSGGQKRFVELVKVVQSRADIALLDEPTNHMDTVGKDRFIDWLKATDETVIVISHDRDVLHHVDRIVELKDKGLHNFNGNYDAYLKQNTTSTAAGVSQYEVAQRTLENLHKQIQAVRAKKAGSSKSPNPFIPMERRLTKQYDELKANSAKPNFWIDQESAAKLKPDMQERYEKYKSRGLRIRTGKAEGQRRQLVDISNLELGYGGGSEDKTLFEPVTLRLNSSERVRLHGRNGVGKTSLVRALLDQAAGQVGEGSPKRITGTLAVDIKLQIGLYEQEVDEKYLEMPLGAAIESVYRGLDRTINDQKIRQLLGDYLFDPTGDMARPLSQLSGGQKARFQIISMLAGEPNLLILDEPTNHLDLPSIEELESALAQYHGAILYISHDSYFVKNLGGETVELKATD